MVKQSAQTESNQSIEYRLEHLWHSFKTPINQIWLVKKSEPLKLIDKEETNKKNVHKENILKFILINICNFTINNDANAIGERKWGAFPISISSEVSIHVNESAKG